MTRIQLCITSSERFPFVHVSIRVASPRPQAPRYAPALVRSESPTRQYDAGVFNLSDQNPVMGGGDSANATGFLFKIEANKTSHFIFEVNIPQMHHVYLATLKSPLCML